MNVDPHTAPETPDSRAPATSLLLRDSAIFLILLTIALILYGVTSFLFRSFEQKREALANQYLMQGKASLDHGQPAAAVTALHTANSYAPGERSIHLLLAQALAASGQTGEATSYFLALHDSEPGNGFVNLQLARLARKNNDRQHAIDYYRSSILGTWQNAEQRQQVELELAGYLIEGNDFAAARAELLVAAANTPDTVASDIVFGDHLLSAKDPLDAMAYYQKALAQEPHNFDAMQKTGRLLFAMGEYEKASRLLHSALRYVPKSDEKGSNTAELTTLAERADRLTDLTLSKDLPGQERTRHILAAAKIAKARLAACIASSDQNKQSPELQSLDRAWEDAGKAQLRGKAIEESSNQDYVMQLIFDTEIQTVGPCGAPQGDDALLLFLAQRAHHPAPAQEVR